MKRKKCLFFVYGTLRSGYGNNAYITEASSYEYLGLFETQPDYTLYDGGFPVVERGGSTSIKGELYLVNDVSAIENIFNLEGCRQIKGHRDNWYDFDEIKTPFGTAVMFVMDKGNSGRVRVLTSGEWVR